MVWFLILVIWLIYPLAATGLLIGLWVTNRHHEKKIEELKSYINWMERQRYQMQEPGRQGAPQPQTMPQSGQQTMSQPGQQMTMQPGQQMGPQPQWQQMRPQQMGPQQMGQRFPSPQPGQGAQPQQNAIPNSIPNPIPSPIHSQPREKKLPSVYPGTAALIIGVIFVVLAGLIFATTTWRVLPDVFKVVLVFAFAVFFFAASLFAGKKLKIQRTSHALYILGSIFLFLTVLAVGYFRLLGPGFVLEGHNRWWVLWVGSLVTEGAFLAGFRNYKEKAYTYVYLGGLTVSMTFLVAALWGIGVGFAKGMVCYSFVLLLCDWGNTRCMKKRGNGFLPDNVSAVWGTFSVVHFLVFCACMMPGILLGFAEGAGIHGLYRYQVTVWSVVCLGIAAAGMRLSAARWNQYPILSVLYNVLLAVLFQYAFWGLPVDYAYRCLGAALLSCVWFTVNWKGMNPFETEQEQTVMMAAFVLNVVILFTSAFLYRESFSVQTAALTAVVLAMYVAELWRQKFPEVRRVFPYLLMAAAVTGSRSCMAAGLTGIYYDWIQLAVFTLIAVWDYRRKDSLKRDMLILGAVFQLFTVHLDRITPPFFLVLSVYLFAWSKEEEGKKKLWMMNGASLCSLACLYLELYRRLPNRFWEAAAVFGLLAAEYVIAVWREKSQKENRYWDIAGSAVFVFLILMYYAGGLEGIYYPALCMAAFLAVYCKAYLGNALFAGLPMALILLPFPWLTKISAGLSDQALYFGTAAMILVSGLVLRRLGSVYQTSGDSGKEKPVRIDWFQLTAWIIIIPMAVSGSKGWRFVYTLLLIPYLLQFASLKGLRKSVLTAVMAVAVAAWWVQPFGLIPDRIALEVSLLPVALFAVGLPFIWGKSQTVWNIQTAIGVMCIAFLTVAAFITGDVWDALMLEGICLVLFVAAYTAKCRRWVAISGAVLAAEALYMTKSFWLSLSWWVYLLAAGAALIGFAAWYEKKNREGK